MMKATYKAMVLSNGIIVAIFHLLAVVHTSSTWIRKLAASGSILHIAWGTGTAHIGPQGILTLTQRMTTTIGRNQALIYV